MSDSRQAGNYASGFLVSPRVAGIVVVAGVIALPGIPVGYLTPLAVFFGALTVYVLEARRYRQGASGNTSSVKGQTTPQSAEGSEAPDAALVLKQ